VGIIREQPIPREPSFQPESEVGLPFKETYLTPSRNEFSNQDFGVVPGSNTLSDNDTQSMHTVSSRFTDLSLVALKARDNRRV